MAEFEAVGEAVAAGMAARSMEPTAGEVAVDGHTQEASCLNCGTALTGDYCAIDDEIGILGRDVLNQFSIIFDGKSLEWKEEK